MTVFYHPNSLADVTGWGRPPAVFHLGKSPGCVPELLPVPLRSFMRHSMTPSVSRRMNDAANFGSARDNRRRVTKGTIGIPFRLEAKAWPW